MLMLNWVDLIILLILTGVGYIAARIGFFRQFCLILGFFTGLIVSGLLLPHILPIKDPTLLVIVNSNLVLVIALYCSLKGLDLGNRLEKSFNRHYNNRIEQVAGVVLGCAATLVVIWLSAVGLGRLPFAGLSNSVNDAFIVQRLNSVLPPVPAIFSRFSRLVDPNAQPVIYAGNQPKPVVATLPLSEKLQAVADESADSTVRLTGFGCGGIVAGSGFVVEPGFVATNAHVIAGVKRPIIKDGGRSYEGEPVLFNANLDLAVLRVKDLKSSPLSLSDSAMSPNEQVAVLGYPNGNFALEPGTVVSKTRIFGSNIYGLGNIVRDVYDLSVDVSSGSSGGPVLRADGSVGGIIFSRAVNSPKHGYALTSDAIQPLIEQAKKVNRKVSTGACLSDK